MLLRHVVHVKEQVHVAHVFLHVHMLLILTAVCVVVVSAQEVMFHYTLRHVRILLQLTHANADHQILIGMS